MASPPIARLQPSPPPAPPPPRAPPPPKQRPGPPAPRKPRPSVPEAAKKRRRRRRSRAAPSRKKKKKPNLLKRYGLLRNFLPLIPGAICSIEAFLIRTLHFLVHLFLAVGITTEAAGTFGSQGAFGPNACGGAAQRLGALAFDAGLGFLQGLVNFLQLLGSLLARLGLAAPSDGSVVLLGRLAFLQSCTAALLHLGAVARWRRRPSDYKAPPLLPFLAHFAIPWSGLSVWLVGLDHGHHQLGGGVLRDTAVLSGLFIVRAIVFGVKGLERAPRVSRTSLEWVLDGAQIGGVVVAFDALVVRGAWLERRENWKYIVAAGNLIWPWFLPVPQSSGSRGPALPMITAFFRTAGAEDEGQGRPRTAERTGKRRRRLDALTAAGGMVEPPRSGASQEAPRAQQLPVVADPHPEEKEFADTAARSRHRTRGARSADDAGPPPGVDVAGPAAAPVGAATAEEG